MLNWAAECAAVIPCLDEADYISGLVTEVKCYLPEIIVVDDASKDRTAVLARESGARVLSHKHHRGKGAALDTGWQEAMRLGFKWALNLDGDGQHSPVDITRFLDSADKAPDVRLWVGNRFSQPRLIPPLRRAVNVYMSRRISTLAGVELPDTQCGFRLMHLQSWAALTCDAQYYEIESDIIVRFLAAGCQVRFVPIQVIYAGERSKIRPLRDAIRWLRWWRRTRRRVGEDGHGRLA